MRAKIVGGDLSTLMNTINKAATSGFLLQYMTCADPSKTFKDYQSFDYN